MRTVRGFLGDVMRIVGVDAPCRFKGSGSGEAPCRNQIEHELEPPPRPDIVLAAGPTKEPVVGNAYPVVLPTHLKRKTIVARESSWKRRELEKNFRFNLNYGQSEFPTAREAQVVHFVDNVSDDVNRCQVLNDEGENR